MPSAPSKRVKQAAHGTPEFDSQFPVDVMFVIFAFLCNVESNVFSCSAEPSPSEVSDSGNNDEEALKPMEKRQYVCTSNLLGLFRLFTNMLFIGVVRLKRCCTCLILLLPKLLWLISKYSMFLLCICLL